VVVFLLGLITTSPWARGTVTRTAALFAPADAPTPADSPVPASGLVTNGPLPAAGPPGR
jgi:hypothetical protein